MPSPLMKSVSGIRGIIGDSLTPDVIIKVASAFARYVSGGTVVVGRDSRPTGEVIAANLESLLMLCGCNIIDIGIVPTPTTEIMVKHLHASGGIMISASHNPIEWNAFKLINSNGTFLNSKEISNFFSTMEMPFKYPVWNRIGTLRHYDKSSDVHIEKIVNIINTKKIRRRKFHVVLDSVNGAGSIITPKLLRDLNCRVEPLYCNIDGTFPRGAEPVPDNLKDLSNRVIEKKADIGFAQDPDADRLAIVDELGRPIGEENTLALVVEHLLSKKPGRVVINLSTTKTVEDIAKKYKCELKRTKVGEINVTEEMIKGGARIGGEGNGGVISPDVHLGRDSLAGIGYILEMMAERGKSISELVKDLPAYYMKKGKVTLDKNKNTISIINNIKILNKGEKISNIDGIRIDFAKNKDFSGGWVHLRSSNTEPIFRIIAEGETEKQSAMIYKHFADMFK